MSRDNESRKAAMGRGEKIYFTETPCPSGHTGGRYTCSSSCVECCSIRAASKRKKQYDKKYYEANKERISAVGRARYERNRERAIESAARWREENPEKVRMIKRSYRYRRRSKEKSGMPHGDLMRWIKCQKKVCYWCAKDCGDDFQVDHYEPLSKDGKHEEDNLVISCVGCNKRKAAKDPYEFAQEYAGRLF